MWTFSEEEKERTANTRLWAMAAEVHLAGFAPAFTLSLCDSEYARKPPVPIASVVSSKQKNAQYYTKEKFAK